MYFNTNTHLPHMGEGRVEGGTPTEAEGALLGGGDPEVMMPAAPVEVGGTGLEIVRLHHSSINPSHILHPETSKCRPLVGASGEDNFHREAWQPLEWGQRASLYSVFLWKLNPYGFWSTPEPLTPPSDKWHLLCLERTQ